MSYIRRWQGCKQSLCSTTSSERMEFSKFLKENENKVCLKKKTFFLDFFFSQIAFNTKIFLIYGKFKFVFILKPFLKGLERDPTLGSKFIIKIHQYSSLVVAQPRKYTWVLKKSKLSNANTLCFIFFYIYIKNLPKNQVSCKIQTFTYGFIK